MDKYGVITGDIVSSSSMEPSLREQLFGEVDELLSMMSKDYISHFETFRGDSLQCMVKSPTVALRSALIIRSFFRAYIPELRTSKTKAKKRQEKSSRGYFTTSFDIRLGIGIGPVDFIKKNKISSSDGEAFRLSGEGLDELMQGTQRLALNTINKDFNEMMEPSILLVDGIIQKWTQNQAELVLHKLQQRKEEEIASLLKISQSAVNQRSKTAQWPAIEKLILYFEKAVNTL